jgi:diaminohydroxyphosphoribosylaminopyrimidine deaminase / 5-amino-6-(5-phosphoribosylamino)uracil reductase
VLADDPRLLPSPPVGRPFHRIVLDSRLRIPLDSRLVRSARRSPVWVFCRHAPPGRRRGLEQAGVRVVVVPGHADGRVPLPRVLAELHAAGVTSVMVEGGSEVLGAFVAARVVDVVSLFRAPLILGGRRSRPAFGGPDPLRLSDALRLSRFSPTSGLASPASEIYEDWYPLGSKRGRPGG